MQTNEANNINYASCIEEDEIDLRELFETVWNHRRFIVVFVFVVTALTLIYALSKPNEYKVAIKLTPQEQQKSVSLGGLGALASMAGVNIGGGNSGITPEIAFSTLLDDYVFMKEFIVKNRLDKMLQDPKLDEDFVFAFGFRGVYDIFHTHADANNQKNDIYSIYKTIKNSISVTTDKKTGIMEISVTHPSRRFAYDVLNLFLEDATAYLIRQNLQNINAQIQKYKSELAKTSNLELKAELAKLISSLVKQKVYINTSKYYKVKVITPPYIPDKKAKVKPKRALILIVAMVTSLILSIFLVFFKEFLSNTKEEMKKSKKQ